jgi:hypothetical protein
MSVLAPFPLTVPVADAVAWRASNVALAAELIAHGLAVVLRFKPRNNVCAHSFGMEFANVYWSALGQFRIQLIKGSSEGLYEAHWQTERALPISVPVQWFVVG